MNYLYNGVELPELPESVLEYAVIYVGKEESAVPVYVLDFYNEPPRLTLSSNGVGYVGVGLDGEYWGVSLYGNPWSETGKTFEDYGGRRVTGPDIGATEYDLVWTNVDILNPDGSVYFAASDPIPVDSVYNLLDMGGQIVTLPGNTGMPESTDFAVGDFPLSIVNNYEGTYTGNGSDSKVSASYWPSYKMSESALFETAKIGDEITIAYSFPGIYSTMRKVRQGIVLWGQNETRFKIDYEIPENSLDVTTEPIIPGYREDYGNLLSDITFTPIMREGSDEILGVSVHGYLLDAIKSIETTLSTESSNSVNTYTNRVTFASYDDLRITINPIPVGGEPLDPTSMTMGWLVGRAVAGQRNAKPQPEPEIIAILTGDVLYIKKAPAVLSGDTLEVK